jgi:hypothetical protein
MKSNLISQIYIIIWVDLSTVNALFCISVINNQILEIITFFEIPTMFMPDYLTNVPCAIFIITCVSDIVLFKVVLGLLGHPEYRRLTRYGECSPCLSRSKVSINFIPLLQV